MPHKRASHSARRADRESKGHDLAPSYKVGSRSKDPHFNAVPKGAARIINGLRVQQEYRARKKAEADRAAGIVPEGTSAEGRGAVKGRAKGKGKAQEDETTDGLKIRPGERLRDFNSRVEQAFAPKVLSAARSVGRAGKRKRRAEAAAAAAAREEAASKKAAEGSSGRPAEKGKDELRREREELEAQMSGGGKHKPLDFAKLEQRKSVRDVVQAPPRLTKAPRGEGEEAVKRKQAIREALGGGGEDLTRSKVRLPDPVKKKSQEGEEGKGGAVVPGGLKRKADLEQERDKAIKAYRRLKGRD